MNVYEKLDEGIKKGKCYLIEVKGRSIYMNIVRLITPDGLYWRYSTGETIKKCCYESIVGQYHSSMEGHDNSFGFTITKYVELTNGFDQYINPSVRHN